MTSAFDAYLETLRQKWTELPAGSDGAECRTSPGLLSFADSQLCDYWDSQFAAGEDLRGWYRTLYRDSFRGKRVLEIGSGMGFDGINFLQQGTDWTFCDISAENLRLVSRVANIKGLSHYRTSLIDGIESIRNLPSGYDFVWANGSLIHLPFDLAREESLAILEHLRPGGRWIELAYPRERWLREGAPPFTEWGKMTDGELTPWVEWYDLEKLRRRLAPGTFVPVLDFCFASQQYIWLDLSYSGTSSSREATAESLPSPGKVETPAGVWHYAQVVDLSEPLSRLDAGDEPVALDVECGVLRGSVGFALATENGRQFVSPEAIVNAREFPHVFTLTARPGHAPRTLVMRNVSRHGSSLALVETLSIRPSG